MVTVKKQNIVIEYVCCECATIREPIHVKDVVFSFTHSNWAQGYSWPCVSPKVCSTAELWPEVAANLKQLPQRMRQSISIGAADIKTGQRRQAEHCLKKWQCILVELDQQSQSFCYVWLVWASCFSRVGGSIFSWPAVKCVGTGLKIAWNHRKKWDHRE